MADKTKEQQPNDPRVFVYGTLKQGKPNHPALAGATLLGRCCIEGPYVMVNLGWYPAVCELADANAPKKMICGEVYRVTDEILHTLDMIEGHPHYYARKKVETPHKKAWVYMLPHQNLQGRQMIEDGMWRPTDEERDFMRSLTIPQGI